MFKTILTILAVIFYPCLSMELKPTDSLTATEKVQMAKQHAVYKKYWKEIDVLHIENKQLINNKIATAEQIYNHIENLLTKGILEQFLAEQPNKALFCEYVFDYANLSAKSTIKAAVDFFETTKYFESEPMRIAWFMSHLMNNFPAALEPTGEDYIYLGLIHLKRHNFEVARFKKGNPKLLDEAYTSFMSGLRLCGTHIPIQTDIYSFLSQYTFEHQLYAEHLKYCELFQSNNKESGVWDKNEHTAIASMLYTSQLSLAQSYFHCRLFKKAVKQYATILDFKHTHNDTHYKRMLLNISLDNLVALYHLNQVLTDEKDKKQTSDVFNYLLSQICNLPPEEVSKLADKMQQTIKSTQTLSKKGKRIQKASPEALRKIVIKSFEENQLETMNRIHHKVRAINLDLYLQNQADYNLDAKPIVRMKELVDLIGQLHQKANNLTGESCPNKTMQLRVYREEMEVHQQELDKLHKMFQELVRRKIREKLHLIHDAKFVPLITPQENLKKEVLTEQARVKPKVKTQGQADQDALISATAGAPIMEQVSINMILSCSRDVRQIILYKSCQGFPYPACTVELLEILNHSTNIKELQDNLKSFDADLKKIKGQQDALWAFRLNRQYRVRFVETNDGFTDVEIGDFH